MSDLNKKIRRLILIILIWIFFIIVNLWKTVFSWKNDKKGEFGEGFTFGMLLY